MYLRLQPARGCVLICVHRPLGLFSHSGFKENLLDPPLQLLGVWKRPTAFLVCGSWQKQHCPHDPCRLILREESQRISERWGLYGNCLPGQCPGSNPQTSAVREVVWEETKFSCMYFFIRILCLWSTWQLKTQVLRSLFCPLVILLDKPFVQNGLCACTC